MKLELFGTIGCRIGDILYQIKNEGSVFIYATNEDKPVKVETLQQAIKHLNNVQKAHYAKPKKEKPETYLLKNMQVGQEHLFDVDYAKKLRIMIIYYRKKYNREFKSNIVISDRIRKFKVTRIK